MAAYHRRDLQEIHPGEPSAHAACPDPHCCPCKCRTCRRVWKAAGRPRPRDCRAHGRAAHGPTGEAERHPRCRCGAPAHRSDEYDAYYCSSSGEWLEPACDDEDCEFCSRRPTDADADPVEPRETKKLVVAPSRTRRVALRPSRTRRVDTTTVADALGAEDAGPARRRRSP